MYLAGGDQRKEAIEAYTNVKRLSAFRGSSCGEYEEKLRPFLVP